MTSCRIRSPWWWIPSNIRKTTTAANPTRARRSGLVSIYVERDSQKPIIIGHNAEHLVRVKKKLRTAVNRIVGQKAKLDLHVKVAKGWQSDPKQLEKLGF